MQSFFLMCGFAAVIWSLFKLYHWRGNHGVLDFGITIMRYRYCLLLCIAPGGLGLLAWNDPYMLSAVLIVRPGCFDILVITMISFFTVGVGLAEMTLIRLNGDERFADRKILLMGKDKSLHPKGHLEGPTPRGFTYLVADWYSRYVLSWLVNVLSIIFPIGTPRTGWSKRRFGIWFVLSLILPGLCLANAAFDDQPTASLWGGIFIGSALAMIVAFIVAILQRLVLGGIHDTAKSGILPFELVIPQGIEPISVMHPWALRLFGTRDEGFSKWMDGPGYTDSQSGVLLAGQAQNLILIAFTALVYLVNYIVGVWWDTGWTELNWPIAFYAVLMLFLIGFFMAGLAYWLDRFGLPPIVFAALYVLGCFWMGASDHYFEVDVKARRLQDHPIGADVDESNAYVVAARGPALQEADIEQLHWANILQTWPYPEINGVKSLVVVTASGGGIQAAAWTTKVLTELDESMPGFSRSIGLISSVSGGSVGAMYYVGRRGPFDTAMTDNAKKSIDEAARMRSLEAVSWGLAFPDFVRAIAPPAAPPLTDRAWALESWWWNQMGRKENKTDRLAMQEVTIRDLIPLINHYKIPPIVFNSTCVETGQRVLISPLHAEVAPRKGSLDWPQVVEEKDRMERNRILDTPEHQLVSKPIDFLDFYDACLVGNQRNHRNAGTRANVRVSTAARLSATFSYVTPVARPCPAQDFGLLPMIQRRLARPTNLERRLHLHFCDGGYADNPGLVTAIRSLKDLLDYYQKNDMAAPFDQVLIVRIEPFPKTAADVAKDNTGYNSAIYGPTAAMHATRVSTQAERGELEMRLLQAGAPGFHKRFVAAQEALLQLTAKEAEQLKTAAPDERVDNPVQRARTRIATFLNHGDGPATDIAKLLSEGVPSISRKMDEEYHRVIKKQRNVKGRSVPIKSVQFRFQLPETPSDHSQSDTPKVVTPPLTWTLTEAQKRDVDEAWKKLRHPDRWEAVDSLETADTISPAQMSSILTPQ